MRPVMNKKLFQILNYRISVHLQDGRQYTGTFLALDKFMNFVLTGCTERRYYRQPNSQPSRLVMRTIEGVLLVRGEHVASIHTEGPPPPKFIGPNKPKPKRDEESNAVESESTKSESAKSKPAESKPVPKRGRGRGKAQPTPVQNSFPPQHPGAMLPPGQLPPDGYGPPPPMFPPYGMPVPGRGYPSTRGLPRHPRRGLPARGGMLRPNMMRPPPPMGNGPPPYHSGVMQPPYILPILYSGSDHPYVGGLSAQPAPEVMPVPNADYQAGVYVTPPNVDNMPAQSYPESMPVTQTTVPYPGSPPVPESGPPSVIVHGSPVPGAYGENTPIPVLDYSYQSVPGALPQVQNVMTMPYVEAGPSASAGYDYPVPLGIPGSDIQYVQFQPQPMMPIMPQGTYYYIDQPDEPPN